MSRAIQKHLRFSIFTIVPSLGASSPKAEEVLAGTRPFRYSYLCFGSRDCCPDTIQLWSCTHGIEHKLLCSFQSAVSESNQHSEKGTLRVALFVEHQAQSSFNI